MKRLFIILFLALLPSISQASIFQPEQWLCINCSDDINSSSPTQTTSIDDFQRQTWTVCWGWPCEAGRTVKICDGAKCGTFIYMGEGKWRKTGTSRDYNRAYKNVSSSAVGSIEGGPTISYYGEQSGHYERWEYYSNGRMIDADAWEFVIDGFTIFAYFDDYHRYQYNAI